MTPASDPQAAQALAALEKEAAQYEKEDDFLSALDVYEDIMRKGWAKPNHLLALGHCYLKNRQRQNARAAWMQAYAVDPNNGKVHETLDHYFPGWEAQSPPPPTGPKPVLQPAASSAASPEPPVRDALHGSETVISLDANAAPPPPPPPRRFADPSQTSLSVETTFTEHVRRPAPAAPAERPAPQRPAPAPPQPQQSMTRNETRTENTIRLARQNEPGARIEHHTESRVNWDYIFHDAAEGLVTGR